VPNCCHRCILEFGSRFLRHGEVLALGESCCPKSSSRRGSSWSPHHRRHRRRAASRRPDCYRPLRHAASLPRLRVAEVICSQQRTARNSAVIATIRQERGDCGRQLVAHRLHRGQDPSRDPSPTVERSLLGWNDFQPVGGGTRDRDRYQSDGEVAVLLCCVDLAETISSAALATAWLWVDQVATSFTAKGASMTKSQVPGTKT